MLTGISKTRIEFESMINQTEGEATLIEETQVWKKRPLFGWLAVLEGILRGQAFHLYKGRNRIGSSPPCDIQITDEGVQDQHVSIRISSNQWILTDLDSESGTFLNGKRIYRNELNDGDKIKIGKALVQIKIL